MKIKVLSAILTLLILVCAFPALPYETERASAAASLTAISQYTLKDLPVGRAVQQIAFLTDGTDEYVFAEQRIDSTSYLTRLKINRVTKRAEYLDHIALEGYGHGESLEIDHYDGKYYVWVGSGASSATTYYWSNTISRFEYTPDKSVSTGAKVTNERVLTNLAYATSTGGIIRSGCSVNRTLVTLSLKDDRLMIFSKVTANSSNYSYCTVYKLSSLNAALSGQTAKNYSLKNAGPYCVAHFQFSAALPNGSIQGLELVGTNALYCSGGASGETPTIYKYTYTSSSCSKSSEMTVGRIMTANYGEKTQLEIESLKYENGTFYCSFNPGESKAQTTEVFSLNESQIEDAYLYANRITSIKGLPVSNTIQNFDLTKDGKTLFTTQQADGATYISRCVLSASGKTAQLADYIKLTGNGIGESFAIDEQNGGIYIWIGSAPVTGDDNYATTVTRFRYDTDASSSTGASASGMIKLTNLIYSARASSDATSASSWEQGASVTRVGLAITESASNRRLVLRVKCDSGKSYYPIYDLVKLDSCLNALSASSYDLKNAYSMLCNTNAKFSYDDLPYGSFQGMDIDGIGADAKYMYFIGGSAANKAKISKSLYTNGGTVTLKAYYYVINAQTAPQGIKLINGNMYVSFTAPDNKNGCGIYVLESVYREFTEEVIVPEDTVLMLSGSSPVKREASGELVNVPHGISVSAFLLNFTNNNKLEVLDAAGTVLQPGALVGTGCTVRSVSGSGSVNDSAGIVVYADVDGDGNVTQNDCLMIKAFLKTAVSLSGLYKKAADTDGSGRSTVTDYIKAKRIMTGTI